MEAGTSTSPQISQVLGKTVIYFRFLAAICEPIV
jgi:hypothetical protein